MKPRVIFWGTPRFAVPILDACCSVAEVSLVITQPDKPHGRGLRMSAPSEIGLRAQDLGIPILAPSSLTSKDCMDALAALQPCVFVVAAYGSIIPKEILSLATPGALNVHPSLLPQYRGPSPLQTALLDGATTTGVTIIALDAKMDHGPILAQEILAIDPDEVYTNLLDRAAQLGAQMITRTLPLYVEGLITPHEQDHKSATYCSLIEPEQGLLDTSTTIRTAYNQIRALQPWPGTYILWRGKRIKIHQARILQNFSVDAPASQHTTGTLLLRFSDGVLEVVEVQPENKARMSAKAFLNGYRDFLTTFGL